MRTRAGYAEPTEWAEWAIYALVQCGACWAWLQVVPDKRFKSAALCRALLEVWLGERAVIPDARASFAQGVAQLIETDETARAEWKPGGRGTDKP